MKDLNCSEIFLELNSELQYIDNSTSDAQKKSIHFKSLRNFIYYYDSFKKGRVKATELLREYIKLIKEENYSFSKEQSKETLDLYITPIAHSYKRNLNFSSSLSIDLILFFFSIPNILALLIFHSEPIEISVLALTLTYWINYICKYPRKKIYGYRY